MTTPTNQDDIVDIRDVIERVEYLEHEEGLDADERVELDSLTKLLAELKGAGGDEQWRGDWYPVHLISDYHFEDYARQLAEDIGAIDSDMSWPCTCIDWAQATRDLQYDYSSVDFDGMDYWYLS